MLWMYTYITNRDESFELHRLTLQSKQSRALITTHSNIDSGLVRMCPQLNETIPAEKSSVNKCSFLLIFFLPPISEKITIQTLEIENADKKLARRERDGYK